MQRQIGIAAAWGSIFVERNERDLELQPWGKKKKRGVHGEGWEGDGAAALMLAWGREEKGRRRHLMEREEEMRGLLLVLA
jgi:hypothetical protein